MVQAPVGQEISAAKQIFAVLEVPAGIQLHVGQGVFAVQCASVGYWAPAEL